MVEIEGFGDILNQVCIAKELHENGWGALVQQVLDAPLDSDNYYQSMYDLCSYVFDFYDSSYSEEEEREINVYSSLELVEFVSLAAAYRRKIGLSKKNNPYYEAAKREIHRHLGFSYYMDWLLVLQEKPRYPFHSRLVLLISHDDYVDIGGIALGLVYFNEWLREKNQELRAILEEPVAVPKTEPEVSTA